MTFLRSTLAALLGAPLTALFLFACNAPADESNASEDVGEAESAYGESTCGTTSNIDVTDTETFGCGDSGELHSSPDGSYGHTDCTHSYILKYTGGFYASGYSVATGVATTSTACNAAHAKWTVYDSSGAYVGSSAVHGSWNSGTSSCDWYYDTGKAAVSIGHDGRVVAQAYVWSCGIVCGPTYIPVEVSVYTTPC